MARVKSGDFRFEQQNHNNNRFRDNTRKRDEAVVPCDNEKDEDEESVQYKLLNNSNFNPSMHSRFINEDSQ